MIKREDENSEVYKDDTRFKKKQELKCSQAAIE